MTSDLLSAGADPNLHDGYGGAPLEFLLGQATSGSVERAALLLIKNGARVEGCSGAQIDGTGYTTLMAAASRGLERVVAELLKRGASVHSLNASGLSALHSANGEACTRLLLDAGASPDIVALGNTPLSLAIEAGDVGKALKLIEAIDGLPRAPVGTSLIHLAVSANRPELIKALVRKGCDVDAMDSSGRTALGLACRRPPHGFSLALLLLDEHADPNVSRYEFGSPLHSAVGFKQKALVSKLLEQGADPNARSKQGRTPLHEACGVFPHDLEIMHLLLQRGADPWARDDEGNAPLDPNAVETPELQRFFGQFRSESPR
jgi:ankyrin repeat protein